jgi:hypothetical protein
MLLRNALLRDVSVATNLTDSKGVQESDLESDAQPIVSPEIPPDVVVKILDIATLSVADIISAQRVRVKLVYG